MDTAEKVEMGMSQGETTEVLPLKSETNNGVQNMTFIEKIKYVKSNITVEPVLAFYVMPSVLAMLATQNLNLDKACRVNLGFGDDVCTDLRLRKRANHTFEEDEVQKLIASVQAWKSAVQTSLPTLLMLFIGAWSDKTGRRKICMLMPIFGEFMTCVLNMANTYFFYEVPVEMTVFMEVLFPSLTGGWYTMFLGTFSYLGDVTSKDTRTFRIGILNLCMTIGFPIGMGLSGILLKVLGFYGVFTISACLQLMNFCYVYFALEDHRYLENKDKEKKTGVTGFLLEFFDLRSLKETLAIAFKKGENNRRLRICLILTVVCLTFGPMWGELSIMYIFARYRFNWDEVKYSIYSTYSLVTHSVGTLFSISVFSKKLRADDAVLGMISAASKICGALVMSFARNDVEAYMSPLVEILNGTTSIALRSIASKLVSYQELGKVFSLFGVAETTMPFIFTPLYSRVYIATLHVLPGAIFLMSVLATIPVLVIFGWFYRQHRKDEKEHRLNIPDQVVVTEKPINIGNIEASIVSKPTEKSISIRKENTGTTVVMKSIESSTNKENIEAPVGSTPTEISTTIKQVNKGASEVGKSTEKPTNKENPEASVVSNTSEKPTNKENTEALVDSIPTESKTSSEDVNEAVYVVSKSTVKPMNNESTEELVVSKPTENSKINNENIEAPIVSKPTEKPTIENTKESVVTEPMEKTTISKENKEAPVVSNPAPVEAK